MEQITVREVNSEVLIFLDKNFPDKLSALREASKVLQREVLRAELNPDKYFRR